MKTLFTAVLSAIAAFFIWTAIAAAQNEASPIATSKQTAGQRLIEKSGPVKLAPQPSGYIPTVAPSPEYRRLPAWDFLPARARIKE